MIPIAVILLAAGRSTRFGTKNKLLAELDGIPLLARTIRTARAAHPGRILLVTGEDHEAITALGASEGVDSVHNPAYACGMGSSIASGVRHTLEAAGWLIWPGDMPFVGPETVLRILEAFDADRAVTPCLLGRRGHPVLFPRAYGDRLAALDGEPGARGLLAGSVTVETDDPGILMDVDTPDDLRPLR